VRRKNTAAKNALDPEVRKKAKLKAQKQAEKDLAAEAKADLKAQKLHQKKLMSNNYVNEMIYLLYINISHDIHID
jgi:hypothetical protein